MKVLLVNPHPGRPEQPIYPLGLAYAALGLSEHEVLGCDLQLQADPDRFLASTLSTFEPEVVAVALRNVDSSASYDRHSYLPGFKRTVDTVRRMVPGAIIIAGGSGFSLFPEAIMHRVPELNFGILFEAEETLPALLENLNHPEAVPGICDRIGGDVRISEGRTPVEFPVLPAPDRRLFPVEEYAAVGSRIGVQTKRGCPFRCVYCTYPYLDGRSLRARSAADVVDEIEDLAHRGCDAFFFCDSVFNVPRNHAEEICKEMLRRDLRVRWHAFFNESHVTEEQIVLARDAGCDLLIFGPDAGHPSTLLSYHKGHTAEDLETAYRLCRDARVPFKCAFLMNGPGESWRSFLHLLAFVLRLRLTAGLRFSLSTMRIYPHTELHDIAVENGVVSPSDDLVQPRYHNPLPLRIPCTLISFAERIAEVTLRRVRMIGRR